MTRNQTEARRLLIELPNKSLILHVLFNYDSKEDLWYAEVLEIPNAFTCAQNKDELE